MSRTAKKTEFELLEATSTDIRRAMDEGQITARDLTERYLERIEAYDRGGPSLRSVIETNPDALEIAGSLDSERARSGPRSPLHGVPVLLKDNLDTADRLHTSAGSLAMANSVAPRDSTVAARLRAAGAVILGKANMTEWANFMTIGMENGYSSRGGQGVNPYRPGLDTGGSSSGSGIAVAANLCAAAIGTETSGSILSPSHQNSVVGIKPTVGLVSRAGVVPISHSQDTPGPMARTVADAAALLGAIAGPDRRDPATRAAVIPPDYTAFLDERGLEGARIGLPRDYYFETGRLPPEEAKVVESAIETMRSCGATVVDPADIVTARAASDFHLEVLLYEFKPALNRYLRSLGPEAPIKSLRDLIRYNEERPETMLKYGQTLLLASQATGGKLEEKAYHYRRAEELRLSRREGLDATMEKHRLDALVFPGYLGCAIAARPGYPSVIVPAGYTAENTPVGITFTAGAWSEPTLIRLAYAFERATRARKAPALTPAL